MNGKHKFVADFLYNDSGVGQENQWTYEWALSLRSEYVTDRWVVMTEGFVGDNGDEANGVTKAERQGHFWAAVITLLLSHPRPLTTWLSIPICRVHWS